MVNPFPGGDRNTATPALSRDRPQTMALAGQRRRYYHRSDDKVVVQFEIAAAGSPRQMAA